MRSKLKWVNFKEEKMKRAMLVSFIIPLLLMTGGCQMFLSFYGKDTQGRPVEPYYEEEGSFNQGRSLEGRFSLLRSRVEVNSATFTADGCRAFISSGDRLVMLDQEGNLLWEKDFDEPLLEAGINLEGNCIALGTRDSKVYFIKDEEIIWEKALPLPLTKLQLCREGNRVMAVLSDREGEKGVVYYMDSRGEILWRKELPEILVADMCSRGEVLAFLTENKDNHTLRIFDREGNPLWEKEDYSTLDVSHDGDYVAAATFEKISLFSREGEELWSYNPGVKITELKMSENGEYLLAHNSFGGGEDNLFFFETRGDLLWQKRIRDDSLVDLSRDGQRIVVSSWRHYSEDFTLINHFDAQGRLRREIEVGSRAEEMALCGDGIKLMLGCDDGNVYILNLDRKTMGEYFPAGEERFYYAFSQPLEDNGDPRITLYFYDENAVTLIPVSRSIGEGNDLVKTALEELIKGPRANSCLVRTIPKGVDIDLKEEGSTIYIDLPRELTRVGGTKYSLGIINSIFYTLTQFPQVEEVKFLVDGEEKDFFGDEGIYIGDSFERSSHSRGLPRVFLPYRTGYRYYLMPRELLPFNGEENDPQRVAEKYFGETSNYFSGEVEVYSVKIQGEAFYVDLSRDILELFEGEDDPQLKARAQVILEGLTFSLTRNFEPQKVQILVEGERVSSCPGLIDLHSPLEDYPYLNPEV